MHFYLNKIKRIHYAEVRISQRKVCKNTNVYAIVKEIARNEKIKDELD